MKFSAITIHSESGINGFNIVIPILFRLSNIYQSYNVGRTDKKISEYFNRPGYAIGIIVCPILLCFYRAQNEAVDGVMAGFWGKCF